MLPAHMRVDCPEGTSRQKLYINTRLVIEIFFVVTSSSASSSRAATAPTFQSLAQSISHRPASLNASLTILARSCPAGCNSCGVVAPELCARSTAGGEQTCPRCTHSSAASTAAAQGDRPRAHVLNHSPCATLGKKGGLQRTFRVVGGRCTGQVPTKAQRAAGLQ